MECLGQNWYPSLDDARAKIETWRQEYNEVRQHGAMVTDYRWPCYF